MSATIWPDFHQDWYINGSPDSTLILGQGGTIFVGDRILDTTTNNWWLVTVVGDFDSDTQTYTGMEFKQIIFDQNLLSTILNKGWKINTNRSYISRSSPTFNTSYSPSSTNDTFVLANVNILLSLLQSSTLSVQIDSGSGFVTILTEGAGSVAIDDTRTLSFIVPANSSYKILSSGSGTNTLNSILELTM